MRARPVITSRARVTGSYRKDTALITGASAGIGLELAKLFAADGHDLVLVARRADALEKLADSLRAKHSIAARIWPADLADPRAPLQLQERAVAEGVAVDILVNNAGFGAIGHFHALPPERQLGIIDVNMRALTEMTYHFLPAMRERRRGRILNLGSIVGFLPGPYMAVYYASKAYVVSFSEALAEELLGERNHRHLPLSGLYGDGIPEIRGHQEDRPAGAPAADVGRDRGAHRLSRPDGRPPAGRPRLGQPHERLRPAVFAALVHGRRRQLAPEAALTAVSDGRDAGSTRVARCRSRGRPASARPRPGTWP